MKCIDHGFASYLPGLSVDSISGVKNDSILVLRSQFFKIFALNFVQTCLGAHALGAPGSGSFRKKKVMFCFSPYGKWLTIIDLLEAL